MMTAVSGGSAMMAHSDVKNAPASDWYRVTTCRCEAGRDKSRLLGSFEYTIYVGLCRGQMNDPKVNKGKSFA